MIPVVVTVWGVFQLAAVNVSVVGLTATSPVSELVTSRTTCPASNDVLSSTANVSVVPSSEVVVDPSDWVTERPGESLSVVVTVDVWLPRA